MLAKSHPGLAVGQASMMIWEAEGLLARIARNEKGALYPTPPQWLTEHLTVRSRRRRNSGVSQDPVKGSPTEYGSSLLGCAPASKLPPQPDFC